MPNGDPSNFWQAHAHARSGDSKSPAAPGTLAKPDDGNRSTMTIEPAPNSPPLKQNDLDLTPQHLLTQPNQHFDRNIYTPEQMIQMGIMRGNLNPVKVT